MKFIINIPVSLCWHFHMYRSSPKTQRMLGTYRILVVYSVTVRKLRTEHYNIIEDFTFSYLLYHLIIDSRFPSEHININNFRVIKLVFVKLSALGSSVVTHSELSH